MKAGSLNKDDESKKKLGTKAGKAQDDFLCALTGAPMQTSVHSGRGQGRPIVKATHGGGNAGYTRPRVSRAAHHTQKMPAKPYEYTESVGQARAEFLSGTTPTRAMITGGVCSAYGLRTWGHLFTDRQLVALTTFSDLVSEARERVKRDCMEARHGARSLWARPQPRRPRIQATTFRSPKVAPARKPTPTPWRPIWGCAVDRSR